MAQSKNILEFFVWYFWSFFCFYLSTNGFVQTNLTVWLLFFLCCHNRVWSATQQLIWIFHKQSWQFVDVPLFFLLPTESRLVTLLSEGYFLFRDLTSVSSPNAVVFVCFYFKDTFLAFASTVWKLTTLTLTRLFEMQTLNEGFVGLAVDTLTASCLIFGLSYHKVLLRSNIWVKIILFISFAITSSLTPSMLAAAVQGCQIILNWLCESNWQTIINESLFPILIFDTTSKYTLIYKVTKKFWAIFSFVYLKN